MTSKPVDPGRAHPDPAQDPTASHPADFAHASHVIGVLGGIASGKSEVARLLAGDQGVLIDADRIAREVLDSDAVRAHLVASFGASILGRDGKPDREALAARVFADAKERARLESFTHPVIRDRIRAMLSAARARSVPRIVLDIPLLLENETEHRLAAECDELVFVDADLALRDARAVARRGWQPGEVARREAVQMPLHAKRARADRVIENRGSQAELEEAVRKVSATLPPH